MTRLLAMAALLGTACGAALAPPASGTGAALTRSDAAAPTVATPIVSPTVEATAVATGSPTPSTPTPQLTPTVPPATATSLRTATPTIVRTATPTPPPQTAPPAGAYTTLAPGSALPSEQQCASAIVRDTWEPRPQNRAANNSNAWANGFRLRGSYLASIASGYEERVTGNFTGTTDQIIRWAACKWGFDENDVRAQAVIESYWVQSTLGDCGGATQQSTNGCASVGLLQVKGANVPATHPGTWPAAMTSTAFSVDYALAVRRLCFDGRETWLREFNASYAAGDVWGCIGRWFSGRWHDAGAESYIGRVRTTMNARTWLSATF